MGGMIETEKAEIPLHEESQMDRPEIKPKHSR